MSMLEQIQNEKHDMEMTPMIDVTFLLLIFFMCTLKFKTLEGKLSAFLPKDVGVNSSQAEPIEKVEILLKVVKPGTKLKPGKDESHAYGPSDTGRYVFGKDRVIEYSIAAFKTQDPDALGKRLKTIFTQRKAAGEPKVPATIDARSGSIYSDVVVVLDQAMEAGFTDITFVGAYDE